MSYEDGLGIAFVASIFILVLFATLFPEEQAKQSRGQKPPPQSEMGKDKENKDQEQ